MFHSVSDRAGKPLPPGFWLILLAAVLTAFVLRFTVYRPVRGATYDEVLYAGLSDQLRMNPPSYDPRLFLPHLERLFPNPSHPEYLKEPLFKHPPLYPWLISRIPPHLWAGTLVSAASGTLTVLAVGFLGALSFDPRTALLAAWLLAVDPAHWVVSGKMWMEATLALLMTCGTLTFISGLRNERWFWISGIFCGLALLTKYTALLTLLSIFLFVLLARRQLLVRRSFWALPLLSALLFWPWLQWNHAVYGRRFIAKILSLHGSSLNRGLLRAAAWVVVFFVAALLLATLRQLFKKTPQSQKTAVPAKGKSKNRLALLPALAWTGVAAVLLMNPNFLRSILHAADWTHLPSRHFSRYFYVNEDWAFGFRRLVELSPLYLAAFASILTLAWKKREAELNLILPVTLLFAAFTLYREFETRYLVPVIPLLLLIAAIGLRGAASFLRGHRAGRIVFWTIVGFSAAKTLKVGFTFALERTVFF